MDPAPHLSHSTIPQMTFEVADRLSQGQDGVLEFRLADKQGELFKVGRNDATGTEAGVANESKFGQHFLSYGGRRLMTQ